MKFSISAFLVTSSSAFSIIRPNFATRRSTLLQLADKPYFLSDASLAVNEATLDGDIYSKLGFEKSQIGIGVDAEEVLQWLGTRDDMIAKFKKDNKGFDDERAAKEVDKFMMDIEMIEKYIAFEKKKAENMARGAEYFKESRKENLSDPSTLVTYALWIGGGIGLAYFKNVIAAPKYASGEWEEIHINLPTPFWIDAVGDNVAEGVASVVVDNTDVVGQAVSASVDVGQATEAVVQASDAVQAVVEAASQSM